MINEVKMSVNDTTLVITANKLRNLIAKLPEININCRENATANDLSFDNLDLMTICHEYLLPDENINNPLGDIEQTNWYNYKLERISFDLCTWDPDHCDKNENKIYIAAIVSALLSAAIKMLDEIDTQITIAAATCDVKISPMQKCAYEMTETEKCMTVGTFPTILSRWLSFLI